MKTTEKHEDGDSIVYTNASKKRVVAIKKGKFAHKKRTEYPQHLKDKNISDRVEYVLKGGKKITIEDNNLIP